MRVKAGFRQFPWALRGRIEMDGRQKCGCGHRRGLRLQPAPGRVDRFDVFPQAFQRGQHVSKTANATYQAFIGHRKFAPNLLDEKLFAHGLRPVLNQQCQDSAFFGRQLQRLTCPGAKTLNVQHQEVRPQRRLCKRPGEQ